MVSIRRRSSLSKVGRDWCRGQRPLGELEGRDGQIEALLVHRTGRNWSLQWHSGDIGREGLSLGGFGLLVVKKESRD